MLDCGVLGGGVSWLYDKDRMSRWMLLRTYELGVEFGKPGLAIVVED